MLQNALVPFDHLAVTWRQTQFLFVNGELAMRRLIALLFACVVVSSASAQIIYEPIRYQYGGQTPFYYGGHDPEVFRFAQRDYAQAHDGFIEYHSDLRTFRVVSDVAPACMWMNCRVAMPQFTATRWLMRNAAYQNAPRYFCKRDLLTHAVQDDSGAWHVPAQVPTSGSGSIEIKPYVKPMIAPSRF